MRLPGVIGHADDFRSGEPPALLSPVYRDPAAILIDQLKEIYVDAELRNRRDRELGSHRNGAASCDLFDSFLRSSSRGTGSSNPSPSRREMVWGRRRGNGRIVSVA